MVRTFPPWYCLSTSSTSSDIVKQCQCQTSRTANSVNCQMVHVNFKLPVIGIMTWGALWVLFNNSRPVIYPGVQASCFEKHVFWPLPFYTWHCQHLLWKWRIRCSHEIDPTTKQILSWRLFTRERWVKVGMFWLILSRRVIDNQVWCAKDFCANICQLIRSCKNMLRAVKLWDAKHISLLCRYFQWAVVKLAVSGERPAHHSSSSWLTNSTHTGSIRHNAPL